MSILTVMFAGPDDVQDERRVFNAAIDSCNSLVRIAEIKAALLPLHWSKHVYPGLPPPRHSDATAQNRPQDEINCQLVDQASAVVAVFADRFGSSTGVAASGTQEEIERARSRSIPCLVCFKDGHVRPSNLSQALQVATYRQALQNLMLTCSYSTAEELQLRLVEWLFAMAMRNVPSRSDARRQAELQALLTINDNLAAFEARQMAGIFYTIAGSKSDALVGIRTHQTLHQFCSAYGWGIECLSESDLEEMARDRALGCVGNLIDLDDDEPRRRYVLRPHVKVMSVGEELEQRLLAVYVQVRRHA